MRKISFKNWRKIHDNGAIVTARVYGSLECGVVYAGEFYIPSYEEEIGKYIKKYGWHEFVIEEKI